MEQRLIDANALQLEPQNGAMNGVLFMGRATGKTLSLVQSCLNAMISNAPTVDAVPVVRCKDCKHCQYDEMFGDRWCNGSRVHYYDKDWFVFPFAIIWEDFLGWHSPPAKRLSIHFLCWHWQWTFGEKE